MKRTLHHTSKTVLAVALAATLLVSLAACGSAAQSGSAAETAAGETAVSQSVTAATTAADESLEASLTTAVSKTDGATIENTDSNVSFVFSDSGISASGSSDGYKIEGTSLTISETGVYTVSGSCAEGSIKVKKEVTGVTLILQDLTLGCSTTAPLAIGKSSEVVVLVGGTVTLSDNESTANESSEDYEGAAIKVKSGASLAIAGDGTLNLVGSCKNGVKGVSAASVTVEGDVTVKIAAANNGLASDGSVAILGGTLEINAGNDGIKAEPDEGDTESAGTVTITGGSVTIVSAGDGIQASGALVITGGSFEITTAGGYQNNRALGDESAKGLKSDSGIVVNGGSFTLNCADDAIHSNGSVTLSGGSYAIATGDDAVHADGVLILGVEGAEDGPALNVSSCYEGLEGTQVICYSGSGSIIASDDGVNAASDERSAQVAIYFYGGEWTVNAAGDGLDSNSAIYIYGGTVESYGSTNNGDAALDFDGVCTYSGGTLLAVGMSGMAQTPSNGVYVSFGASGMGGFGGRGGWGQSSSGSTGSFSITQGSSVEIRDSDGNSVYAFTGVKSANSVVFASEDIVEGETYTLYVNGSAAATATAQAGNGQSGMGGMIGGGMMGGMFGGQSGNSGGTGENSDGAGFDPFNGEMPADGEGFGGQMPGQGGMGGFGGQVPGQGGNGGGRGQGGRGYGT